MLCLALPSDNIKNQGCNRQSDDPPCLGTKEEQKDQKEHGVMVSVLVFLAIPPKYNRVGINVDMGSKWDKVTYTIRINTLPL